MLITGATGLLGSYLSAEAKKRYEVYTISHRFLPSIPPCNHSLLDLTDNKHVMGWLERIRPEIIAHCAALTDVDLCEVEPDYARAINTEASRGLAHWAAENDAQFVLFSTDSVFDGVGRNYRETDAVNPLNVYARSKVAAERNVIECCQSALVIRTNFFGWSSRRKTLAEWMLSKLLNGERFKAFEDIRFSPLFAGDLAQLAIELIGRGAAGVFHVSAVDSCSKYEFALMLARAFNLSDDSVEPASVSQFSFRARRPADTSLCVERITECLGREMPTIRDGIIAMRSELASTNFHPLLANQRLAISIIQS